MLYFAILCVVFAAAFAAAFVITIAILATRGRFKALHTEAVRLAREDERRLMEDELYRQMGLTKEAHDAPTTLPPAA